MEMSAIETTGMGQLKCDQLRYLGNILIAGG